MSTSRPFFDNFIIIIILQKKSWTFERNSLIFWIWAAFDVKLLWFKFQRFFQIHKLSSFCLDSRIQHNFQI